jgi:acyl carrier protein
MVATKSDPTLRLNFYFSPEQSTMVNRSSILDAVFIAVQNTNEALPIDRKIGSSESEPIIGEGAKIDSLGFVTLMVAVEQEVEAAIGSCPSLVEELSDPSAGVTTLGQLVDYIGVRIGSVDFEARNV